MAIGALDPRPLAGARDAARRARRPVPARRSSFGSEHRYYVGVASSGQLGRLLPLYGVLGAAALALGWHALRGRVNRPVPFIVSIPRGRFLRRRRPLGALDRGPVSGENVLAYFLLPFAVLVVVVAPRAVPALADRGPSP